MSENLPATRESRYVATTSLNPVMDTAAFEHMGRIANVMAMSGLMHKTLTHDKDTPLNIEVVKARAFLIVEQASRLQQSPMALMQVAYFVHGKLGFEAKFVSAILEEVFNIRLDYLFGTWDAKNGLVILPEKGQPSPGESDLLGVIVFERIDDEEKRKVRIEELRSGDRDRCVEGYVGNWKTTGNGSPWRPGAMKRQMRYRGAREWARAYRASAILGIVTDDEPFDNYEEVRVAQVKKPSLMEKLNAPTPNTGFNAQAIQDTVSNAKAVEDANLPNDDGEGVPDEVEERDTQTGELFDTDKPQPEIQDAEVEEVAETAEPESQPKPENDVSEQTQSANGYLQLLTNVENAKSVGEIVKSFKLLTLSPDYADLTDDAKRFARLMAWKAYEALGEVNQDDAFANIFISRLFIEFNNLDKTLFFLAMKNFRQTDTFVNANDDTKAQIEALITATTERLKG